MLKIENSLVFLQNKQSLRRCPLTVRMLSTDSTWFMLGENHGVVSWRKVSSDLRHIKVIVILNSKSQSLLNLHTFVVLPHCIINSL